MWQKLFLVLIICFSLSACNSESESVEGYWMAENGDTISFNSDGKAIIEGMACDYSIYDGNNLSIYWWGFASEYRFDVDKDILTLTELGSNSTQIYYRNQNKQSEIQENLNQIAAERAEREQAQKEQEEYEKYIKSLKSDIKFIDSEIEIYYNMISDSESMIADYEYDIQEFLQKPEIYDDEFISSYRESQDDFRADIEEYQQKIAELEAEREEIINTLVNLGEY
ncbi:MAG: hypothetical protein ACI4PD_05390 [Butyricicoccus sp.]